MGIVSSNFGDKRENLKYRNFGCTFSIKNAHSDRINCLCHLLNGVFLSGSSDKTLKLWNCLDPKPLGQLEEDQAITLMLRLGKTA